MVLGVMSFALRSTDLQVYVTRTLRRDVDAEKANRYVNSFCSRPQRVIQIAQKVSPCVANFISKPSILQYEYISPNHGDRNYQNQLSCYVPAIVHDLNENKKRLVSLIISCRECSWKQA